MANERLRSIRVGIPPSNGDAPVDQWMRDVAGVINELPISIFSTSGGPNASNFTAPEGFLGIETGSSATRFWGKNSGSTSTGWIPFSLTTFVASSGTWLPTLTNTTNVSASSAYIGQYVRVGNVVNASVRVDVDPTLTTTATVLRLSPPIASSFGATEQAAGTAFASDIAGQGAAIRALAGAGSLEMAWISGDVSNQAMYCTFTYRVI